MITTNIGIIMILNYVLTSIKFNMKL